MVIDFFIKKSNEKNVPANFLQEIFTLVHVTNLIETKNEMENGNENEKQESRLVDISKLTPTDLVLKLLNSFKK